MKHIHADLMLEYAKDASDRDSDDVDWDEPEINIRRIDPYRELREAQERGANVEYLCGGEWVGPTFGNTWSFDNPPDCYRIKPKVKVEIKCNYNCRVKPKMVKKYRWVMRKNIYEYFVSTGSYATAHEADLASDEGKEVIQRIDSAMIEVET